MNTSIEHSVTIEAGVKIHGDLAVPDQLVGAVVFAHGSGSSRHSLRNRMVAGHLQQRSLATLLVVGGADTSVLELNRQAQRELRAPSQLEIIPGASHLFEEPGALQAVARIAGDWFWNHLSHNSTRPHQAKQQH